MPSAAARPLDARLYRSALSLCPAGFRREHGDEMAHDFEEARGEAAGQGVGTLCICWLLMAIDLLRTFAVQWLRTGFPAIALVATLVTLAIAEGLAMVARRTTVWVPADLPDADVLGVLFLAVISVVLIAMTITLSLWVSRPSRRGRW